MDSVFKKKCELAEKVDKVLRDGGVFAEVCPCTDKTDVEVLIHWGDWKHDHLRADWLIKEIGGTLFKTYVTEDNGSDCYSAVHKYIFV